MQKEREQHQPPTPPRGNNRSTNILGAAIVLFGIVLLLRNLGLGIPFAEDLLGWESILIIVGIVIGINSKFQKKSSVILITIGSLFLLKRLLDLSLSGVILPIGAIVLGIYFIVRNRQHPLPPVPTPSSPGTERKETDGEENTDFQNDKTQTAANGFQHEGENYVKIESIFGSVKKIIFAKNFLGGTLTNLFGSSEINLLQADLQQPVVLDVFQLCGSTKIIVPPHWVVVHTISSILSENDDRRALLSHNKDENKCLYITGSSICGSIIIKNS